MNKLNLFFILAVILCITAGCEKDNQNGGSLKIEAKVINGNDYNDLVDEVRVVTTHIIFEVPLTEVVTCNYKNGGFALTLPKKIVESAYSFTVNGQTSMTTSIYANFYAYKNNERVGEFVYCSVDSEHIVRFYYACESGEASVNMSMYDVTVMFKFKKGWNTVYFSKWYSGYDKSLTKPNAELNWYFIPN